MTRKACLILLLMLLTTSCRAYYDQARIDAAQQVCRLEKALAIYPAPNDARKPDIVLDAGTIITLLQWEDGGWLKIGYSCNNRERVGYALASHGLMPNGLKFPDVTFVHSHEITGDGYNGYITLEAVVNGQTVSRHTMPGYGYISAPIFTAKNSLGLKNAQVLLSYYTDPEFCAIRYDHLWVWTGTEVLPLITTVHAVEPEGDWYDESLLFPADNAPQDTIIKLIYTTTQFDDSNFEYRPLDPEYAAVFYRWDGHKLTETGQNAVIQNWKEWDF